MFNGIINHYSMVQQHMKMYMKQHICPNTLNGKAQGLLMLQKGSFTGIVFFIRQKIKNKK